jgi:hypothetical protein
VARLVSLKRIRSSTGDHYGQEDRLICRCRRTRFRKFVGRSLGYVTVPKAMVFGRHGRDHRRGADGDDGPDRDAHDADDHGPDVDPRPPCARAGAPVARTSISMRTFS